jgi:hypothetical protein
MVIATYIIVINTFFRLNMDNVVGICVLLALGAGLVLLVASYFLD